MKQKQIEARCFNLEAASGTHMDRLPQSLFDVFALSLPRGHGFGDRPPVEAWQSDDGISWGVVTRDAHDGSFGILVLRRRVDHLWTTIEQRHGFAALDAARDSIVPLLKGGLPPEPVPPGTAPRPQLYDLQGREPSDVFKLLTRPSHHVAAWLLHQVYLALPNPDKNWAGDCQTGNFHTRLWEAHLLASFREQGLLVTQPCVSPDFCIQNRSGAEAWVEAVTANPAVRYNHVGSQPSTPPTDTRGRFLGPAALRFAKTLGSKLQRRYDLLPHVVGKPFVIALADFHAPGSMVWSREALIGYLYGMHVDIRPMCFVLVFILHVTGSDLVTLQIPTTTEKACEAAKAKLLGDMKEAGLGRAIATCLDTGRAV